MLGIVDAAFCHLGRDVMCANAVHDTLYEASKDEHDDKEGYTATESLTESIVTTIPF